MVENMKQIATSKHSAIELSVGTIVIIVLAMIMLILGIVLVRSIMCGAVGLTGELNTRIKGEIGKIFDATGGEISCIGAGEGAVALLPGEVNYIWCGIKAKQQAEYDIKVKSIKGNILSEREIQKLILFEDSLKKTIAPGDEQPKKFLRLNIPDDAPEDSIIISVEVYRDGTLIYSPDLDFKIKRIGLIRTAMC